jgi:hypothetical protein
MSDEEDPEVEADIRLRESSRFDRSRNQGDAPTYVPPKIVDRVPCRNRCGSVVSWTEEAENTFQTFNRHLAGRAEAQLDKTKIAFCNTCRTAGVGLAAERNRKQVDYIAARVRELKGGCNSDRYGELLKELTKAGHPDVDGLRQALTDKANAKSSKRVAKGSL